MSQTVAQPVFWKGVPPPEIASFPGSHVCEPGNEAPPASTGVNWEAGCSRRREHRDKMFFCVQLEGLGRIPRDCPWEIHAESKIGE